MPTDVTPKMVEESGAIIADLRRKLQRTPEDAELKAQHETAMEHHRGLTTAQNQQLQQMYMQRFQSGLVR